jgi:phenol/toluene 2-monooxygenase (NADH) P0/A0
MYPRPSPCYVRVTGTDRRGYIAFQFALGDPTLFLDMILPPAAFAEFCATHRARHLCAAEALAVDLAERRWRGAGDDDA